LIWWDFRGTNLPTFHTTDRLEQPVHLPLELQHRYARFDTLI
jgi:hypothetical protein